MIINKIYKFVVFLVLFSVHYTCCDDEAKVETVQDEDDYYPEDFTEHDIPTHDPDEERNARLFFSYPQSPIIDMVLQTAAHNYEPKHPNDLFDFLRDAYPLPGGLRAPYSEYDFIVIGAGSAGSAVASRLSEKNWASVLVLEAGQPEMLLTDIPALAPYFQATDYTYQYYMEHQPGVCLGMHKERCFWPRGKAVGGTSVVNYMIYTRGRPQDWDRIAADGNYGWSYNEVLEYYRRTEKANLNDFNKEPYRNRDGILPVEFVSRRTELVDAFLESGGILGHRTVDYNSPDGFGFGYVQVTTDKGHRQSAAKIFLHPHKRRKSLHILPGSKVTKILIDPQTNTAYGVEYVRNRLKYTVRAKKEVIVSAGPIASPQLLMLSGVGPQDHLNELGIPVLKDLPVGRTLYDHICFPGLIFTLNQTDVSFSENKALQIEEVSEWLRNGDSALNSPGAVEAIGYIKTEVSQDPELVPDIELISIGGSIVSDGGEGASKAVRKGMRIRDSVFNEAFGSIDNKDTWSAFPMLLHPKSKGYILLRDNNPHSFPKMYGNYLTERDDVLTFIAAIRHIQALTATEPFQRFGAKVHPASYKQCRGLEFDSDEYWECALRTLPTTLHHQIATCRMGPPDDPMAVVDPELRVYGINNLRVVDSSVIPRTISAHTNAPAIMIGEKAADIIKTFWKSYV